MRKWSLIRSFIWILPGLISLPAFSQKGTALEKGCQECRIDQKFTKMFARDCCGVTGADGEYSVLLPDGRTVWIFGDSFLGTVNPDVPGRKEPLVLSATPMACRKRIRSDRFIIYRRLGNFLVIRPCPKGRQFAEDSLWYLACGTA
jgi:hypothetical protein